MKRLFILLGLLAASCAQMALAQQSSDEHTSHHPEETSPGQPGTASPAAAPATSDKLGELLQNMNKIQALMKRIHETTDPATKEALMNDHLRAMRDEVRRLLAVSPAKGMGMMGGGAMGAGDGKMGAMGDDAKGAKADEGGQKAATPEKAAQKPDMMGGDMMGGDGMMRGGMVRMHKAMEVRMRIMEMMLEQMLEREAVEAGTEHEH